MHSMMACDISCEGKVTVMHTRGHSKQEEIGLMVGNKGAREGRKSARLM